MQQLMLAAELLVSHLEGNNKFLKFYDTGLPVDPVEVECARPVHRHTYCAARFFSAENIKKNGTLNIYCQAAV